MPIPEESPSALFQRALKVTPNLAEALAAGGLISIEEVAYYPLAELRDITGLEPEELSDLRRIASLYLLNIELGDAFDDSD